MEYDDATVAYWTSGRGREICLFHGLGCTSRDWTAVAKLLSSRFRVICVDFPGHGRSTGTIPTHVAGVGAFVGHVIERLCVRRPVIVGHSMGGMAALAYSLDQSAGLDGLVMSDAFPHIQSCIETFGIPQDPFGYGAVFDDLTPQLIVDVIKSEMESGMKRVGTGIVDSILGFDHRKDLASLSLPKLFILGGRRVATQANLPRILDSLGIEMTLDLDAVVVDSHHFVMLEQPIETAEAIADFASRAFEDHSAPTKGCPTSGFPRKREGHVPDVDR